MRVPAPFQNAPSRQLPDLPLPAYRHVPGLTRHPRRSAGHSVDLPEPTCEPLTTHNWMQHQAWLHGVDLFNQAYWWESHEQWEAAWRQAPSGDTTHMLQGLIQLGAALIKWNLGNDRGRSGLWQRSRQHLQAISASSWMGLDAASLVAVADHFFAVYPQPPVGGQVVGPILQLDLP